MIEAKFPTNFVPMQRSAFFEKKNLFDKILHLVLKMKKSIRKTLN